MLDSSSSADEAIDKFFKVADLVLVARSAPLRSKSPLARTSLYPAEVELIKQLCTTRLYKTDPAPYDNFARFVAGGKRFTQFTGAQLAVAHPTKPDAQPALSYAHKFVEPLSKPELQWHFPTGLRVRENMFFMLRSAGHTMLQQNKLSASEHVDRIVQGISTEQECREWNAKLRRDGGWRVNMPVADYRREHWKTAR
ncbi:hypothetical protein LTR97_012640 [Elasticomyces elasticus]|uniref:Uncharacterized protein n=1 Tax=Elasticomyces elasticus TaxID=574655 RepID=A0AAN7VY72_9PEZI|nr:hypothetical protein LTR97_012640 [Elasticomyces elasticus]